MAGSITTFESAARSFAGLVHRIPGDRWDGPGLGDWDLRSLVGHTSRSLITVSTYLETSAEREDVATPQAYYARIREVASDAGADAIVERGRQAGRDLGADPAGTIDELVQRVLGELASTDNPLIEVIGGLGIRLQHISADPDVRAGGPRPGYRTGDGPFVHLARGCAGRGHGAGGPDRRGNGPRGNGAAVLDGPHRAARVVFRCLNLHVVGARVLHRPCRHHVAMKSAPMGGLYRSAHPGD